MTPYADLAVRAFLQERHHAARKLLELSNPRERHAAEPDEPTAAYVHLLDLLRRALDDEADGHPRPFDAALDDLVELQSGATKLDDTAPGDYINERIRCVGLELGRLANRDDMTEHFGPRVTVGEALWQVASAPEPAGNPGDDRHATRTPDDPIQADDRTTTPRLNDTPIDRNTTTVADDETLTASTTAPEWHVPDGYLPSAVLPAAQFAFSGTTPQADVRISSSDRYRRTPATLHRAGRVQGPRTTILVRLPTDAPDDHQAWSDHGHIPTASVRFELASTNAATPAHLAFHDVQLTPTEDGFTLNLDMDGARFATDRRPDQVWSAILGARDVDLWVSLNPTRV